ncbi:hypothetical protein DV451_004078 [Geotrichum candidum]|uniref:Protein kinase domain-containing protein n=1 Tax=Geotrichum candidum TaxID=1173061 RepID=A0A9P5G343_GEOCN|nr:hypothetical protein DV451_004078 [Geotrichum candidum]KAF5107152.1 hypothetical protein DV453_003322 [Geotrichum candidum]
MPVFENLKNFIRHGKSTGATSASTSSTSVSTPTKPATPPASNPNSANTSSVSTPTEVSTPKPLLQQAPPPASTPAKPSLIKKQNPRLPFYPGLEQYALLKKMGDGAFSVVYKAYSLKTDKEVAIKVVRKNELSNNQRASILKEVAIMRQLKHKNITDLLEFIETKEHFFIVLELVQGGELFHQIVKLTYFSEDLARHVIVQVASAIRYLHEEAGVVHRDIKPENLLFQPIDFVPSNRVEVKANDEEDKEDEGLFMPGIGGGGIGTIKLADFGLSKIIWDQNTMTPCGTVGYTAPEIVNDQRYSKSVDMWALGCVLYTILCGFPPFYDESVQVLTEKVAKGEYTFLSPWWDDISKEAKDLVSHLLTVNPERRYTIEQFLSHPWITQTREPTVPAYDSPLTRPQEFKTDKKFKSIPLLDDFPNSGATADEASAAAANEKAYLSPAIAMKEAFFVFNQVHIPEEEESHSHTNPLAAARRRIDTTLAEVDEGESTPESEEDDDLEALRNLKIRDNTTSANPTSTASPASRQPSNSSMSSKLHAASSNGAKDGKMFELKLDSSTLLERRKRVNSNAAESSLPPLSSP